MVYKFKNIRTNYLSNSYRNKISINGKEFPSIENYLYAQKFSNNPDLSKEFEIGGKYENKLSNELKKIGEKYKVREDWDTIKYEILDSGIYQKIKQNHEVKNLLSEIDEDEDIIYINDDDDFGKSSNILGNIYKKYIIDDELVNRFSNIEKIRFLTEFKEVDFIFNKFGLDKIYHNIKFFEYPEYIKENISFINNTDISSLRILTDENISTKHKYEPHSHYESFNLKCHWGQRKLHLSEVELLNIVYKETGRLNYTVLYIGSNPGYHLSILSKMYPDIEKFILYDGRDGFLPELRNDPKFEIHAGEPNGYFNDKTAQEIKKRFKNGNDIILISDIRRTVNEEMIKEDMAWQQNWVEIINPKYSLLKFRLQWGTYNQTEQFEEYLEGDILLPIFGSKHTTESRLLVRQNAKRIKYDDLKYENQMYYFNNITRQQYYPHNYDINGIDHCYDCKCELYLLEDYFKNVVKNDTRLYESINNLSNEITQKSTLSANKSFFHHYLYLNYINNLKLTEPESINNIKDILYKKLEDYISRTNPFFHKIDKYFSLNINNLDWVNTLQLKTKDNFDKYQKFIENFKESIISKKNISTDKFKLNEYQSIVKNYIQDKNLHKGLLVYHGLGIGKTLSSIAVAESGNKKVIVLSPASLKSNYITDLKSKGNDFYKNQQRWVFIPNNKLYLHIDNIKYYMENEKVFLKNNGLYYPVGDEEFVDLKELMTEVNDNLSKQILKSFKNNNIDKSKSKTNKSGINIKSFHYNNYDDEIKKAIDAQIDEFINKKYQFISFNGLTDNVLKKITNNHLFENKIIVIDEVHQFINTVANGSKLALKLYEELLFKSLNSKLILLSGTPILNYIIEISYIINLLRGVSKKYIIPYIIEKGEDISTNEKDMYSYIFNNTNVRFVKINSVENTVEIEFFPKGFEKDVKSFIDRDFKVKYNASSLFTNSDIDILYQLKRTLDRYKIRLNIDFNKIKTKKEYAIPLNEDEFKLQYYDEYANSLKNTSELTRQMVGYISYYEDKSNKNLATTKEIDVNIPFSSYQYNIYLAQRMSELLKEQKSKKMFMKKGKDFANNISNTYKAFSRIASIFVFPKNIERSYPSKMDIDAELIDKLDQINNTNNNVIIKKIKKDLKIKTYDEHIKTIMKKIDDNKQLYLTQKELEKYSPKYKYMLDKINNSDKEKIIIYNQFRNVEGLNMIKLILNVNGWHEFKLKRNNNEWVLDLPDKKSIKDMTKFYFSYETDDDKKVILDIFNSNYNNISEKLKQQIKEYFNINNKNDITNFYGEIVKSILISVSGASGINIKEIRQIHIITNYWNDELRSQIIGRGIRYDSHNKLKEKERNVTIYTYNHIFSEDQKKKNNTDIIIVDKNKTTDELIYDVALKKKTINNQLLKIIQNVSININNYSNITNKENENNLKKQLKNKLSIKSIQGTKYLVIEIDKNNSELYDMDIYKTQKSFKLLGHLKKIDNKLKLILL